MNPSSLIFWVSLLALLAGCASSRPTPSGAPFDVFEAGALVADAGPLTPEIELTAATVGGRRWRVIEGEHAGGFILESWREENGTFTMTRRLESETTLLEEQTYRLEESKGLVLERSINHERGVIAEFTPRMLVLPNSLSTGNADVQTLRLRLPLIENPKRLREQGTTKRELTLLGTRSIRLGARELRAWRVREVVTNTLGAARAVRTTDRWLTAELGSVAEQYEEEVKALGFTVEKTRRVMVLEPASGGR